MTALPGKPASNASQSGQEQLLGMSPGERLQRARKEQTLEVAEVAERLNLSPGVVRALEADDYRMLPNATFVKGYLRSYARTLGISGDDLVRSYEAITGCNQPVKLEPIAAPMISDPRKNARNVLLAVLALALVGVGIWQGLGGGNDGEPAAVDAAATSESNPAGQGEGPVTQLAPPVVVTRPPENDAATVAEAESINEPVEEAPPATAAASALPEAEPVEPVAVETSPEPQPAVAAEPQPQPTPSAPEAVATTTATGLVTLKFQGECWVEVRDGAGDLVFSSLKRGGEEVTLRAATPINVKLGNGDVVEVLYNHQAVPFTTRPDRKVVRLTLGE